MRHDSPDTALRALADATGLSRERLASVLGISRSALQSRISGRRGRRWAWAESDIALLARLSGWSVPDAAAACRGIP